MQCYPSRGGSGTVPAPDQGVAFFISVLLFSSYISYKQLTLSGVSSLLTLGHNVSSAKLTLENHEKNSTENLSVLSVFTVLCGVIPTAVRAHVAHGLGHMGWMWPLPPSVSACS